MEVTPSPEAKRNAIHMLLSRGRLFPANNGKRRCLHVFSKIPKRLDEIVVTFGGNYYRHRDGYAWMASSRKDMIRVAEAIRPHAYRYPEHRLAELFEYLGMEDENASDVTLAKRDPNQDPNFSPGAVDGVEGSAAYVSTLPTC